jgi:hypothetical protein
VDAVSTGQRVEIFPINSQALNAVRLALEAVGASTAGVIGVSVDLDAVRVTYWTALPLEQHRQEIRE